MREPTRKKLVYLLLVGAAIWGLYNFPGRKRDTGQSPGLAVPAAQKVPFQTAIASSINIEEKRAEPWGKDPFRVWLRSNNTDEVIAMPDTGPRWVLAGVLFSTNEPLALVNGQTVGVGDTVDEAQVIKIERKVITLEHLGKRFTLSVVKG